MTGLDIFSRSRERIGDRNLSVVVDYREKNSLIVSELIKLGLKVRWEKLEVGDYIVKGIVIERKSLRDLKMSIVNRRINSQLKSLLGIKKKLLLIEGLEDEGLYGGKLHENALRGFLLNVGIEHGVPMIFSLDVRDSARYIYVLANRKGKSEERERATRIFRDKDEQMRFILEGFPNIGPGRAKKLLDRFGSLGGVFRASEDELREVIGHRSIEFREWFDLKYGLS